MIVEAVGEVILGGKDAHPNYALLLARLFEDLAIPPRVGADRLGSSRADLAKLQMGNERGLIISGLPA